jgi:hypothetical protein
MIVWSTLAVLLVHAHSVRDGVLLVLALFVLLLFGVFAIVFFS